MSLVTPFKLASALVSVALTCFMGNVTAYYSVTPVNSTAPVPISEQVSPGQLFAKEFQIRSLDGNPLNALDFTLLGRVFITYAENTSSDASDLVAKIKVSADSKDVIDHIDIKSYEDNVRVERYHDWKASVALLIEIQLLRKNALSRIWSLGECDVVVLENVMYSSDTSSVVGAKDFNPKKKVFLSAVGPGSIFVADKTGSLVLDNFEILASKVGNVQVELAAVRVNGTMKTTPGGSGNITLFIDDLDAHIDAEPTTLGIYEHGKVCISAKNNVNVSVLKVTGDSHVSYPGKQHDVFPCVRLDLPARVPARNATSEPKVSSAGSARALSFKLTVVSGLVVALLLIASV